MSPECCHPQTSVTLKCHMRDVVNLAATNRGRDLRDEWSFLSKEVPGVLLIQPGENWHFLATMGRKVGGSEGKENI